MFLLSFFRACSGDAARGLRAIPTAFGTLNEIVVVMDEELWESPVGDTIRWYYSAAYPLLPQPEPIFDLRHFTVLDLNKDPLRKELRTYMAVADLSDEESATTKMIINDIGKEKARRAKEEKEYNSTMGRDKWAKGQLLIYQFAHSTDELIEVLKSNYPAVRKRVYEHDENKIDAFVYLNGINKKLAEEVKEDMGINIRMPSDYFMALNDDAIIWMRKETEEISSNIILKRDPLIQIRSRSPRRTSSPFRIPLASNTFPLPCRAPISRSMTRTCRC